MSTEGSCSTQIQAQETRLVERETLIHGISAKQAIKGFDHSPLERDKVLEFLQRLSDLQHRQNSETESLQVGWPDIVLPWLTLHFDRPKSVQSAMNTTLRTSGCKRLLQP
jgi:hypothetical protein